MAPANKASAGFDWKHPFARALTAAGSLIMAAAFFSLIALVYLSWSSSIRLDPLERHLAHLQNLQSVNLEVQSALINEVSKTDRPDHKTIEKISLDLRDMLRADGFLHQSTPNRILSAQKLLLRDGHSIQDNLAATFDVLEQTLKDENQVQRAAIAQARDAARRESMIALFALFIVPMIMLAILIFFRRRLFAWSESLTEMLVNVRNSNLSPVSLPDPGDPMHPVIDHYNAMVERLREIEVEHTDKQLNLEHQVQVASDSLLRVQRHLAQSEQLSAIGEFSARVAHELRNPLSGIIVAVRNLRDDVTTPDKIETVDLILEELERVSRLLNSLLARTPQERELFVPTSLTGLCSDMITLFGYECDRPIAFQVDVPDCQCELPRDSLRQAILNILRNSAQAMGDGGGRIAFSAELADQSLTLAIEDSGPGYPEDILRNGIRPFRTDKDGGSGLGLSILQRLIHNAGGTLKLGTASEGGARTLMTLPCDTTACQENRK